MESKIPETKCGVCTENPSKYKCPKCSINYCSMTCYKNKAHLQCSEKFYRQCVMGVLKGKNTDQESKEEFCKMLERLQKQFDLESVDDVARFDEPQFVSELDDESKKLWDLLSVDEKKKFCGMKDRGEFESLVELWQPWWTQINSHLIEDNTQMDEMLKNLPPLYDSPDFSDLVGNCKPSDKLCFSVLNIIYGYAYIMRLYNGDCVDLPIEVAHELQGISSALGDSVFPDAPQALGHCMASFNVGQSAKELSVAIIEDVICILRGPNCFKATLFIECSLSHCLSIIDKAAKMCRKGKHSEEFDGSASLSAADLRKTFLRTKKKLEFLIRWVKKYGHLVSQMIPEVEEELHVHLSSLSQMKEDKEVFREAVENKFLFVSKPNMAG